MRQRPSTSATACARLPPASSEIAIMNKLLGTGDLVRLRRRLLQMHHAARVGHIGGNLSCLDILALLHAEIMEHNDRLVLSKGHAAGALYIALWAVGKLSDADIDTFHADGTKLPGHPPSIGTSEIPFATGSLGHGLSLAGGLALSHHLRGSAGRVFCVTSDGEWQEGSNWEALTFAVHNQLGNLTVIVDRNGLQGFGTTQDVASMHDLAGRFEAFGCDVVECSGHDLAALRGCLTAPHGPRTRIVIAHTVKGNGISFMENRMEWHYLPLTDADLGQAYVDLEAVEDRLT